MYDSVNRQKILKMHRKSDKTKIELSIKYYLNYKRKKNLFCIKRLKE